jgi:hypothetical protein
MIVFQTLCKTSGCISLWQTRLQSEKMRYVNTLIQICCANNATQSQVAARKPCDIICGRFRKPPTTFVCVSACTQTTTFTCPEFRSTFKAQWLLYVPPGSTVQNSVLPTPGSQNKQRLFPHTTLTDWFL